MDQALAAANALEREAEDVHLMRALEAAIAVSYARAFTKSTLLTLDRGEYAPADPTIATIHEQLYELRNKVYAHTDKTGGREVTMSVEAATGLGNLGGLPVEIAVSWNEQWRPLDREAIPAFRELFESQRGRLLQDAAEIQMALEGLAIHVADEKG